MRSIRKVLLSVSLLWCLAAPAMGAAQEEDPGEERAETFEAAGEGAQTENIPGGMLMVTAYGIVFALVLGYVFSIGFRQTATARDLERLRRDIESADATDRA